MKFWIEPINNLNRRDVLWLGHLACGVRVEELHPRSPQYAKTRMARVRSYLGVRTTTQAVVEAMRRGIITLHPEIQCNSKSDRATMSAAQHGSD